MNIVAIDMYTAGVGVGHPSLSVVTETSGSPRCSVFGRPR